MYFVNYIYTTVLKVYHMSVSFPPQYKASKEGTVMGVAVSKISMLTHCQALTQACNYCEGQSSVF